MEFLTALLLALLSLLTTGLAATTTIRSVLSSMGPAAEAVVASSGMTSTSGFTWCPAVTVTKTVTSTAWPSVISLPPWYWSQITAAPATTPSLMPIGPLTPTISVFPTAHNTSKTSTSTGTNPGTFSTATSAHNCTLTTANATYSWSSRSLIAPVPYDTNTRSEPAPFPFNTSSVSYTPSPPVPFPITLTTVTSTIPGQETLTPFTITLSSVNSTTSNPMIPDLNPPHTWSSPSSMFSISNVSHHPQPTSWTTETTMSSPSTSWTHTLPPWTVDPPPNDLADDSPVSEPSITSTTTGYHPFWTHSTPPSFSSAARSKRETGMEA